MVGERIHTREHMQRDTIYLKFTNGYNQAMTLKVRTVVILGAGWSDCKGVGRGPLELLMLCLLPRWQLHCPAAFSIIHQAVQS